MMLFKKIVLLFTLAISFCSSNAQWYTPENVLPNAVKMYNTAIPKIQEEQYKDAIEIMKNAIMLDSKYLDAYLTMAGIQGQLKEYNNSIANYEKAIKLDSVYTASYLLPYSIQLAGLGKFEQALQAVQKFKLTKGLGEKSLSTANYRIKCYQFAIDYAKQMSSDNYEFAPKNLGAAINTNESEYFPSITIDAKKLVFTRRLNDNNEDFYETNFENNTWTKATPIPGDVNTSYNEGAQNISQDGSILFFTGCLFPEGKGYCDLYYSLFKNNSWSKPIPAGKNINTEYWESQPSLSPDKRTLYFAAEDPSCIGGSDLFYSEIDEKGIWGIPMNLGKKINTKGNESCPFLHADGESLYFASDGLQGYGGKDLFVSHKDSTGKWGTPINLGYPINTIENDATLSIAADGVTAYYASDRSEGFGGLDIYSFTLRKAMQSTKTLYLKGFVYDKTTNKGIASTVELNNITTGKLIQKIQTDSSGNYFITLPIGKEYSFNVNKKGYLFYSDNFNLIQTNGDSLFQKNIGLQPLTKNAMIVLKNIFYATNKFNLAPQSQLELEKVIQLLNDNPTLKIEIDGHTDNVGTVKTNLQLSNKRAKSVVDYIVQKGINKNRLTAKGFGATKPITDNKTEEGKAKNRRTELKIIGL